MIRELLPEGVAVASIAIASTAPKLFAVEEEAIASAVPERRLEFATGRACARDALGQLGIGPQAIPVGRNRAPQWPVGIVGSITHSASRCFAAVGQAADFIGVGIDVELNRPLSDEVRLMVTTNAERAWLANREGELSWDTLIFSVKECVYKVWYPVVGRWLGFEDVEVSIDVATSTFEAQLNSATDRADFGEALAGRFAHREGLLLAALWVMRNR